MLADDLTTHTRIAELITAKMTHDLAGPVGGINNGIEFLEEADAEMLEDALGLLKMSGSEALAKLQLFRQAYGVINNPGTLIDPEEVKEAFESYLHYAKKELVFSGHQPISQELKRLLFLAGMLAANALMIDGQLKIVVHASEEVEVSAGGGRLRVDEEIINALAGKTDMGALSVKDIQPHMLCEYAKEAGYNMQVDVSEEHFLIKIAKK